MADTAEAAAADQAEAVAPDTPELHAAASRLQAAFRGRRARSEVEIMESAALRMQAIFRGHQARTLRTHRSGSIPEARPYDGSEVDPALLTLAMEDDDGGASYPDDAFTAVKMLVGTWNLGHAAPPPNLSQWLPVDDIMPDIVVISFQECNFNKTKTPRTDQSRRRSMSTASSLSTGSSGGASVADRALSPAAAERGPAFQEAGEIVAAEDEEGDDDGKEADANAGADSAAGDSAADATAESAGDVAGGPEGAGDVAGGPEGAGDAAGGAEGAGDASGGAEGAGDVAGGAEGAGDAAGGNEGAGDAAGGAEGAGGGEGGGEGDRAAGVDAVPAVTPSKPSTSLSSLPTPKSGLRTQRSTISVSMHERDSTDESEGEESGPGSVAGSPLLRRTLSMSRDPMGSPRGGRTPKSFLRAERRRSLARRRAAQREARDAARKSAAKQSLDLILGRVSGHLGPDYICMASERMYEIAVVVYVHKDHEHDTLNIRTDTESVGQTGLFGNKGAAAVKFDFYETSLCFVGCHLSPHEDEECVAARNSNLKSIFEGLHMGIPNVDAGSQFDHCFVIGDLNYRLDLSIADGKSRPSQEEHVAEIAKMAGDAKYFQLYKADQLRREMREGHALRGFQEGILRHPPTFKLVRKAGFTYNAMRRPAWTDRILWRSAPAAKHFLKQEWLYVGEKFSESDHKPLAALFTLTIPPPAIPFAARVHGPIVAIFAMEGENLLAMDAGGSSDPYIQFHTIPDTLIKSTVSQTRTRVTTLNPTWYHEKRPLVLQLFPYPIKDLRRFSLMFHIQDWDLEEEDDNMGCALLSMDSLVGSSPDKLYEEEVPVLYGGLPGGTLRIVACIVEPDHELYHKIRKRKKLTDEDEVGLLAMCGSSRPQPVIRRKGKGAPGAPGSASNAVENDTGSGSDSDNDEAGCTVA